MIGDTKVNLGPFATLFGPRFGFFDDRKAWGRGPDSAFGPARRFSACFGRVGGCAQGSNNSGHGPADLLRGGRTLIRFPRQVQCLNQRTGQHQLVLHGSHQQGPALKLLGGAQARLIPQQGLFLEAIAMFVRVAPLVEPTNCATRLLKSSSLIGGVKVVQNRTPRSCEVAEPEGWRAKRAEEEENRGKARKKGNEAPLGEANLSEEKEHRGSQGCVKPSPNRARRQRFLGCRTA